MKPGVEKYFFAAAVVSLFLAAMAARAQSLPLGYATNFSSVAYFEPPHEQQVKMRLSGAEMLPLPGGLLDLKKLKVETFATNGLTEAVVQAPQCTYAPFDRWASSPGRVEIRSGDGKSYLEGEGFWLWQTNSSLTISISNHVHTVIAIPAENHASTL